MKKIIILILIIIGLIVLGFVYWQGNNKSQDQDQNQEPENMIGGQKDEHGCLIGAGYTVRKQTEMFKNLGRRMR